MSARSPIAGARLYPARPEATRARVLVVRRLTRRSQRRGQQRMKTDESDIASSELYASPKYLVSGSFGSAFRSRHKCLNRSYSRLAFRTIRDARPW